MSKISNKQIQRLTGLTLRSSLSHEQRAELIDSLADLPSYKAYEVGGYLSMNQLDLTQLANYNNSDINKRLDYIEANDKM